MTVDRSEAARGLWRVRGHASTYEVHRVIALDPSPPAGLRRILINDTLHSLIAGDDALRGVAVRHRATVAEAAGSRVDAAIAFGALAADFCGTDDNPSVNCGGIVRPRCAGNEQRATRCLRQLVDS